MISSLVVLGGGGGRGQKAFALMLFSERLVARLVANVTFYVDLQVSHSQIGCSTEEAPEHEVSRREEQKRLHASGLPTEYAELLRQALLTIK